VSYISLAAHFVFQLLYCINNNDHMPESCRLCTVGDDEKKKESEGKKGTQSHKRVTF